MSQPPIRMSVLGRFTPAIALIIAVGLLGIGIGMAAYNEHAYRAQKTREVDVQAQILASALTAAVAFDDRHTANEYVGALRANPDVRAVAIYDARGTLFASYARDQSARFPTTRPPRDAFAGIEDLVAVRPVTQEGAFLGTVYLRTILESTQRRLTRYAGVALLFVLVSMILAVLGMAHGALRRANRQLEDRAAALAESNRELQAQIEEREKAERALRQAQKMETIGQLTGGVAHDFNNLLTIILGNLERLRRSLANGAGPEQMRAAIDSAIQGAERAAALTRSLLAFSRRQPLDPKVLDVNALVRGMSDLLSRAIGEHVAVRTELAENLWHISADRNQLENAILNLAVNGRDAMPGGGTLAVETENAVLDGAGDGAPEPGEYVMVSVRDTGTGMAKEVLAQAFDPFFTTKGVGHGTGLGLSQVYGFVKQSGGHVEIESAPGQGTVVRLYLPRTLEDIVAEPEPAPAARKRAAPRATVLVVEDEPNVRQHSVALVRELGYQAIEAEDGAAALAALESAPEIALLFTDIGLPGGMNGRALADAAVKLRPELKVLYTTGYAREAVAHEGRREPGVHLIMKPFSYAQLEAAIRQALDGGIRRPRALVVEDEVLIRMTAVDHLKDLGFDAVEAGTAAEAREKIGASPAAFDAALIDLGLPDRSGAELAAEIRALCPDLPIVIATGYATDKVREQFSADPLIAFLEKPYDGRRLAAALSKTSRLPLAV